MDNTLVSTDEQQQQSKQKTQEQLSSPLSQILKTYDFGNFEICELIMKLLIYHQLFILICTIRVEIHTNGSD